MKMNIAKINAYEVGLVFYRGAYVRTLKEGTHLVWKGSVVKYNVTQPFNPPVELNILLKDAKLANELIVVEVADHEIVLQYENGLLKQVLNPGRYAFWQSVVRYEFVRADVSKIAIDPGIQRSVLQSRLLNPFVRSFTLENYEKGLLFVDGRFAGLLDSGTYFWWKNGIGIHVGRADMRLQQLEINGQEILTKDKAALRINAWARYKIIDLAKALMENKEYDKQLYVALQLALRAHVGGLNFDEMLDKKESIALKVADAVGAIAMNLGIELNDFGIRDIILPGDVKEIMNQVLVAEKKAQANSIMRREETASTRSLLNTAKLMEDNAMLWKLKEMEYVERIAERISNISIGGNGAVAEQLKQLFLP
jgi:regulator of protease activity HflC (stomatin/prohibitin superfamily)